MAISAHENREVLLCGECAMWKDVQRNWEGMRYGTCDLDGKKHYRTHICTKLDVQTENVVDRILLFDRAGMYPGQIAQRVQLPSDEVREILKEHKQ